MYSYEDIKTAYHEAGHAALAWVSGVRVERCSIDRWSLKTGQAGLTATTFHDHDERPLLERARVRVMITLAGPLTGRGTGCEGDLERATTWCDKYDLSLVDMARATDEVRASELFRTPMGDLQIALLEERELDEARVTELCEASLLKLSDDYEPVKRLHHPTDAQLLELITALEETT